MWLLKQTDLVKQGADYIIVSQSQETITQKQYDNYINSMQFMRNLGGVEKLTNPKVGHTKLISISPDKQDKIIRNFYYEPCRN